MNTVFKLGYQAWLLLAIAARRALAVGVGLAAARRRGSRRLAWAIPLSLLLARRGLPVRGHLRAQGRLRRTRRTSTACAGCRARAPGDPAAIDWLRDHAPHGSVVLEAVGDDYSAFGHGRISTFTGRRP